MPESAPQPPNQFANEVAQRFESLVNLGDIQSRIAGSIIPGPRRNDFAVRLNEAMQEKSAIHDAAQSYSNLYLASRAEERSNHAHRLNTHLGEIADRIDKSLTYHAGSHDDFSMRRLNILKTIVDNPAASPDELASKLNPRPLKPNELLRQRELGLVHHARSANTIGFKPFDAASANALKQNLFLFRSELKDHMLESQRTGSAFRNRETDEDSRSPRYGNRMAQAKQDLLAQLRIRPSNPDHQVADVRHVLPDHILGGPAIGRRMEREASGRNAGDHASGKGSGFEGFGEPGPSTFPKRERPALDEAGPSNSGDAEPEAKRQRNGRSRTSVLGL